MTSVGIKDPEIRSLLIDPAWPKPVIRKWGGWWKCISVSDDRTMEGWGTNPSMSYQMWLAVMSRDIRTAPESVWDRLARWVGL